MAASITASPNPVGFWSPTDKRTTTISWDTGGEGNGYVNVTQDTGPEQPFDVGTKLSRHSKAFSTPDLALGHQYTFTLHRQDNDTVIAKVTVTTEDLEQRMLDQTSKWAMQQRALGGAPQAITDLSITAAVDTVRISFSTVQATIPSVTVHAADGTQVAAWLPLFGGLQTPARMHPRPERAPRSADLVPVANRRFRELLRKATRRGRHPDLRHRVAEGDAVLRQHQGPQGR
jgi:hypothetical protein